MDTNEMEASKRMAIDVFEVRSDDQVQSALTVLLEGELCAATLGLCGVYVRRHDDTNGRVGLEQEVAVTIEEGGAVVLTIPETAPLRFLPVAQGGRSRRTRNALVLLAEAIRRESIDSPQHDLSHLMQSAGSPRVDGARLAGKDVLAALDTLLDGIYWIPVLNLRDVYIRQHDDAPTEYSFLHEVQGTFGPDGDAWLMTPGFESLRFRQYSGGGKSMRTLGALQILFEAIRRDNAAET
jgi:hypothetical protein